MTNVQVCTNACTLIYLFYLIAKLENNDEITQQAEQYSLIKCHVYHSTTDMLENYFEGVFNFKCTCDDRGESI